CFEVTETAIMRATARIGELRDMGVRVVIDDFGTGYSSLQYLRQLEADELKIDRSFVADLDGEGREQVLIEAILRIADDFEIDVIVEGIETDDQLRHVRELGGRFGQGFYFDRPMPAEQFAATYLAD
ncbi:MAG: EAL domain-containing protein, partial [Bradymonadaceae bacterium]